MTSILSRLRDRPLFPARWHSSSATNTRNQTCQRARDSASIRGTGLRFIVSSALFHQHCFISSRPKLLGEKSRRMRDVANRLLQLRDAAASINYKFNMNRADVHPVAVLIDQPIPTRPDGISDYFLVAAEWRSECVDRGNSVVGDVALQERFRLFPPITRGWLLRQGGCRPGAGPTADAEDGCMNRG